MPTKLESHPAAGIFPLMEGSDFAQLVDDIAKHGQRTPIQLYEGKILDGRNRYRACEKLGLEPVTEPWQGSDPFAYVASMNLYRRHLNDTQRAMAAARLADAGVGRPKKIAGIPTIIQAAEMMKVSRTSVNAARTVIDRGTQEEIAAADAGTLPLDPVSREIRKGVPPEDRSKPKKRGTPRPGLLSTAVYARIAAENEKKRTPTRTLRRRQVRDVPEVAAVANGGVSTEREIPGDLSTLPEAPQEIPTIPEISFTAAIERLISARLNMSADEAALEIIEFIGAHMAHQTFGLVLLWLIDVGDKLETLEDEAA